MSHPRDLAGAAMKREMDAIAAAVVPFTTRGSYALNQHGSLIIRRGTIDITFSPPLRAEEWKGRSIADLMSAARSAIELVQDNPDHPGVPADDRRGASKRD